MFSLVFLLLPIVVGYVLKACAIGVMWSVPICFFNALILTYQWDKAKLINNPFIPPDVRETIKKTVCVLMAMWLLVSFALSCTGYYLLPKLF